MSEAAKPVYQVVDGLIVNNTYRPANVRSAFKYVPRSDDIFVTTYPKCGTTWTQQIVFLILNDGHPARDLLKFYEKSPYLEVSGKDKVEAMPRPGTIKSHLEFDFHPYSKSAKFIYVVRNPKDACVSHFHHTRNLPPYQYSGEFNDFFEIWMNGEVEYGDYFDHVLSWWKHREESNVFIITYEEMKAQTSNAVLKIASFLGQKYRNLVQNQEVMDRILKYSSVEYMQGFFNHGFKEALKLGSDCPEEVYPIAKAVSESRKGQESVQFIRKGVVNDWKNYLSKEQEARIMQRFWQANSGSDIIAAWRSHVTWLENSTES